MRQWLKELRKQSGLSQCGVAEKSGISQNYYSTIETGERNPAVETAKKIAEALHFDWTRFYEDEKKVG